MTDLHKAIRAIHNNVIVVNGDSQKTITAKDKDGNNVNVDWTQVNDWIDPDAYKYKRVMAYPSIAECVHAILDGELDALQAKRKIVKERHPKGGN